MSRREFITLGCAAAMWPLAVRAQRPAGRVYRVGYFAFGSREQQAHLSKAFEEGLQSLGYRVNENVTIEYRFADGQFERLPTLAAEIVRLGVDVIVTGNHANAVAAMKATTSIPIVMTNSTDPVSTGLVADLARPGGNVTGLSVDPGEEISGKRLELLREILPNLSRVGILWNPDFVPNHGRLTSMREATQALGLTLVTAEASGLNALEQAFATFMRERAQVLVVLSDGVLFNYRRDIGVMALSHGLPAISSASEYAEAGLLLSYGPDLKDLFRRSAVFVDKIFKGAKPADLPIEQPIKYKLVMNVRTAKTLGLDLQGSILAPRGRGDRVRSADFVRLTTSFVEGRGLRNLSLVSRVRVGGLVASGPTYVH
jgi:putative ABC transport system substrate-binding protein